MIDRYTKTVLTVIAGALIYLCIVLTAFPAVSAQSSARPGEPTGPGQVVVVGWRANEAVPVSFQRPVPVVTATEPLRIIGTTQQAAGAVDRIVLAGWENGTTRDKAGPVTPFTQAKGGGLPVQPQP